MLPVLVAACTHQPPAFDPVQFQSMALHFTVSPPATSGDPTSVMTTSKTALFGPLARPIADARDAQDIAPGLRLVCQVDDGRLTVTASATAPVRAREEHVARCTVGDVEIPVWITVDPSPAGEDGT